MSKLPDTFTGEDETRTIFVLDSKSERPRIRIEKGKVYGDGVFRPYYDFEVMPQDRFFEICSEYWSHRNDTNAKTV